MDSVATLATVDTVATIPTLAIVQDDPVQLQQSGRELWKFFWKCLILENTAKNLNRTLDLLQGRASIPRKVFQKISNISV